MGLRGKANSDAPNKAAMMPSNFMMAQARLPIKESNLSIYTNQAA